MSIKKISSSIRLRTDTVTNWFINRNQIIQKNELVVVDFENGSVGLKFGEGKSYQNTDFIKFLNLCTDSLTNGDYTFTFPSKSGEIVIQDDLNKTNAALQSEIAERVLLDQKVQTYGVQFNNLDGTTTDVSKLVINRLTKAEYDSLKEQGKIKDSELYFVDGEKINGNNQTIINVANPVNDTDAANKRYVDEEIGKITIPTKTSELQNDSGFLTQHQSLSAYAKKTEIPTKTSQLTNDSGFLTQHQSLTDYATKSYVNGLVGNIETLLAEI